MQVTFHFRSADDWSAKERGDSLIRALTAAGLRVERFGTTDPPRLPFDPSLAFWTGSGLPGFHTAGDFHFRGSGTGKFRGWAAWNRDLPPGTQHYNSLTLSLTVRREIDPDWLVDLGDHLFAWASAAYGLVTSLADPVSQAGGATDRLYLPGLFWVNYFGDRAYADLTLPPGSDSASLPLGRRVVLAGHPEEMRNRSQADLTGAIGPGWFAQGPPGEWRLPSVDFSPLWRGGER